MSSLMSIGEIMKERPAVDPKALAGTLRFRKVNKNLVVKEEIPLIYIEGILKGIKLGPEPPDEVNLTEDGKGLCAKFVANHRSGDGKIHYIYVFDYRKNQLGTFNSFGAETWFNQIFDLPCLATMRKKKCQYIALADIGDSDIIIEKGYENLFLLRRPIDHEVYRVMIKDDLTAIHSETGICIAEKR